MSDSDFPSDWPWPPNTTVTASEREASGGAVVSAISDLPFHDVLDFMRDDLAAAGFRTERGDVESEEAEGEWESDGYAGQWAILASSECEGTTLIRVLSAAQKD